MDVLGSLLGQGPERERANDFVGRYEKGAPWDDISEDEALDRYQQVATRLPPDAYEESAADAFSRLDPNQRREFGQFLQQQAGQRGFDLGDLFGGRDASYDDPRTLGRATARLEQREPGILGQLLGGGGSGGGMLSHPIGKAALGGIAAMAIRKFTAGR